ncbi:acyl homoserine lactone synthase [Rhizobium mesoamericanum]|uniref:acyl-homoserine-lactone synthase n=1 Tax=Rhizobium mesoamericanum TaxID=1079800 RepID=UPI002780B0EB|nr:acyl-homoserine-lactone synthase [Rhizobium mesoamericanum]MDQ0561929.1 acyl homoserine lactone synthase [Rhizobium mesoamericanum]
MQVMAICRAETSAELRLLEDMYRLRAQVFGERLGWVECRENYERDEFDVLNPTYILAIDADDHVIGCARLLPASGPTMLESVFSSLLEGRALQSHPRMVESSRFCVDTVQKPGASGHLLSETTQTMFAAIVHWCCINGYSEIVTVTDVGLERLLNRAGWPLRRLGDPQRINETMSVAGILSADRPSFERLRPAGYQENFRRPEPKICGRSAPEWP